MNVVNGAVDNFIYEKTKKASSINLRNINLADKSYVKWEANGGKELQLSAFKLTNRQMLWLCDAHVFSTKYHEHVPKDSNAGIRLENEFQHIFYKSSERFREAFGCGNMTQAEIARSEEYKKKSNALNF